MGHRKHSAPRRGSLAYYPRSRAHGLIPRVRAWSRPESSSPSLGGFVGFKVGMIHLVTVDDREKTPNFGKPLFVPATVLSVSDGLVTGVRLYQEADGRRSVLKDINVTKEGAAPSKEQLDSFGKLVGGASDVFVIISVKPSEAGLEQKSSILFEVPVVGGSLEERLEFALGNLGKKVQAHKQLQPGQMVDVASVSKGKGFEGPITRFGVKRKQHKSRKSVRAVGVLSPWHPHDVMYTVARAGQKGFHQRVEYNHKIMALGNEKETPVTPAGGFPHFGVVKGDYLVLKGSIPGPFRRPVIIRQPVRARVRQPKAPQLIYVSSRPTKVVA
ncbi:MAG: 50S ribosomal protein L3 [Nitrososphaerota archaeon]|nr:50S ribosomal protein L3 [Nitrososphaerota archaeon]